MKILLLNQPVYNRGDEAAHRSLIRTLNKNVPNASVMILLENVKEGTIKQIKVDNPQNISTLTPIKDIAKAAYFLLARA